MLKNKIKLIEKYSKKSIVKQLYFNKKFYLATCEEIKSLEVSKTNDK